MYALLNQWSYFLKYRYVYNTREEPTCHSDPDLPGEESGAGLSLTKNNIKPAPQILHFAQDDSKK